MRWFARTEQLLGVDGYDRLSKARVAIFGLGGVGGYACEALARAGIGHLRIVDHDVVNSTNLNRQLLALRSTLGLPKVDVMKVRILDINPECDVDSRRVFINNDTFAELFLPEVDVVVDAIDSLNSKTGLIEAAFQRGLPVVSSLGAGGRMDGGQIQCGDLFESYNCPLASKLRQRLRRRGIARGIRGVYSVEDCQNTLPHDLRDVDKHEGPSRSRPPLGTISYMPALFGLRVAQEVIRILLRENLHHRSASHEESDRKEN
jgi:tRNA A37 threonylcarbamoyladenosine dehydratase